MSGGGSANRDCAIKVKKVWGRKPHTFFSLFLRNRGPQTHSGHNGCAILNILNLSHCTWAWTPATIDLPSHRCVGSIAPPTLSLMALKNRAGGPSSIRLSHEVQNTLETPWFGRPLGGLYLISPSVLHASVRQKPMPGRA